MRKWQKIAFALVIIGLIALIFLFWGSIFSGIIAFTLIMTLPTYLYNRFLNADSNSDYMDDGNF